MLVVCGTDAEPWSVIVSMTAVDRGAVRGVDPEAGLHTVRARGRLSGATRLDPGAWQSAVAVARRSLARQIAGASRTMLDLARTHAMGRVQFGRPVARFQAVRHRLAESLVAVEALEASLSAARDQPSPDTAALAAKWLKIIFVLWSRGVPYDETHHLATMARQHLRQTA